MSARKRLLPSPSGSNLSNGSHLGSAGKNNSRGNNSYRGLNSTVRSNRSDLRTTLNPPLKEKLFKTSAPAIDYDLEFDFVNNELLQNLMKRQIAENVIDKNKRILNIQLLMQKHNLLRLEATYKSLKNQIDDLQKQNSVVEVIDKLEGDVKTIHDVFETCNVNSFLSLMADKLRNDCDKVILKNIKPISKQEELDSLQSKMASCQAIINKIMQCGADNEELQQLANSLRHNLQLQEDILNKIKLSNELTENAMFNHLKLCSDYFA